jgi:hypothetical protein|nr:MAG: hypothetical protein [Bacteriophage sp.]
MLFYQFFPVQAREKKGQGKTMEKEKNETLASEIIADLMKTADKKKKLIDLINSIEKPEMIDYLLGLNAGLIKNWRQRNGL